LFRLILLGLIFTGIAVHWLDMIVYWTDYALGHIMFFKPDGRYHTILLRGLNKPRGLAVDAATGFVLRLQSTLYILKLHRKSDLQHYE
jgi:hypothetical protein